MVHESEHHDANSFLTLTYNSENLPANGSLVLDHWKKFAKRLRRKIGKFRFYHCGEYGDQNGRPHYHVALFGHDFSNDRVFKKNSPKSKMPLYTSALLDERWGKGDCYIGELTPDSCAYVAGYVANKITGQNAQWHYEYKCPHTGETTKFKPEYSTMSRNPGIGEAWFKKWGTHIYPRDTLVHHGRKTKPPRYYDVLLEKQNPKLLKQVKQQRVRDGNAKRDPGEQTFIRRSERAYCAERRMFLRDAE